MCWKNWVLRQGEIKVGQICDCIGYINKRIFMFMCIVLVSFSELSAVAAASGASGECENYNECNYLVNADEHKLITAESLYNLYVDKETLTIRANDYEIVIDGKDIVNYDNEFLTDINLKKEENGMAFTINDNKPLCGNITVSFREEYGKYVYLYNNAKEKYEWIDINGNQKLTLSSAGKYIITDNKMSVGMGWIIYAFVACAVIMVSGCVVYIFVKKRYWFW